MIDQMKLSGGLLNPSVRQPQREISKIRIVANPGSLVLQECPCNPWLRAMTSSNSKHTERGESLV